MGKGSKRRKPSIDEDQVQENWDRIFGKSKSQQKRLKAQKAEPQSGERDAKSH